ncbi:hypothetical protein CSW62_11625 [Caulobacter sp. FWC2]|nr:hypothetical protein CSW62_11625 [Caulobacter sp. FWC2]
MVDENRSVIAPLSDRQRQILRLVARGRTSKEIALAIGLSPHGVDMSLRKSCERLGVANRREAARLLEAHESSINDTYYGSADLSDTPPPLPSREPFGEEGHGQLFPPAGRRERPRSSPGHSGVRGEVPVAPLGTNSDAEVHMGAIGTTTGGPFALVDLLAGSSAERNRHAAAEGAFGAARTAAARAAGGGFDPPRGGFGRGPFSRQLTSLESIALALGLAVLIGLLLAGVLVAAGSFMGAMQRTIEAASRGA